MTTPERQMLDWLLDAVAGPVILALLLMIWRQSNYIADLRARVASLEKAVEKL